MNRVSFFKCDDKYTLQHYVLFEVTLENITVGNVTVRHDMEQGTHCLTEFMSHCWCLCHLFSKLDAKCFSQRIKSMEKN